MSPRQETPCTHDRGPGTTVCFRCRYESGLVARERFRRVAVWGSLAILAVPALVAVANAGASAIRGLRGEEERPEARTAVASAPLPQRSAGWAAESVRMVALTSSTSSAPSFNPVLFEGTATLRAGVEANRHGDTVIVSFDTPATRTRRADRFEDLLRATLPRIYGATADSALAAHPARLVTDARVLLTELPRTGLTLRASGGRRIVVWPETRPGQDGPLVVRYRTALAP